MTRTNRLMLGALFALLAAGWGATGLAASGPVTILPEAVTLFGEAEGKPVKTGYVFIDGRFVRPPYKVGRKGNGIFINGMLFQKLTISATPVAAPEEVNPEPPKAAVAPAPAAAPSKVKTAADALGIGDLIDSDDAPGAEGGYVSKEEAPSILPKAPEPKVAVAPASPLGRPAAPLQLSGQKKKKKYDANDLFEEADYTFTPPKRPEPPAVPYVRPAAEKSMKERMEEAKERDAARAAAGGSSALPVAVAEEEDDGTIPDDGAPEEVESFEGFDEVRVANAQKSMDTLCRKYEALLKRGDLVYGGTTGGPVGYYNAKAALTFIRALPEWLKLTSSTDFEMAVQSKGHLTLDLTVVQQIFENRMVNSAPIVAVVKQMDREEAARKAARDNRIR